MATKHPDLSKKKSFQKGENKTHILAPNKLAPQSSDRPCLVTSTHYRTTTRPPPPATEQSPARSHAGKEQSQLLKRDNLSFSLSTQDIARQIALQQTASRGGRRKGEQQVSREPCQPHPNPFFNGTPPKKVLRGQIRRSCDNSGDFCLIVCFVCGTSGGR